MNRWRMVLPVWTGCALLAASLSVLAASEGAAEGKALTGMALVIHTLQQHSLVWAITAHLAMGTVAGVLAYLVTFRQRMGGLALCIVTATVGLGLVAQLSPYFGYALPGGITTTGLGVAFATCLTLQYGGRWMRRA